VAHRIRRKLLIRRLTLPVAALIGVAIAIKPLSGLLGLAYQILLQLPDELVESAVASLPTLQLVVTGGLILVVAMFSLSMLED
jgi:hypothetical protein